MEIRSIIDEWNERPKELNAALEEASVKGQHLPRPIPEWFQEFEDKTWQELTDQQRAMVADFVIGHEGLAVKPRDPIAIVEKMLQEAEVENKTPVHAMHYDSHGSKGVGVYCTCGMYKKHSRGKVLAAWADRHHTKTGHLWAGQDGTLR